MSAPLWLFIAIAGFIVNCFSEAKSNAILDEINRIKRQCGDGGCGGGGGGCGGGGCGGGCCGDSCGGNVVYVLQTTTTTTTTTTAAAAALSVELSLNQQSQLLSILGMNGVSSLSKDHRPSHGKVDPADGQSLSRDVKSKILITGLKAEQKESKPKVLITGLHVTPEPKQPKVKITGVLPGGGIIEVKNPKTEKSVEKVKESGSETEAKVKDETSTVETSTDESDATCTSDAECVDGAKCEKAFNQHFCMCPSGKMPQGKKCA